MEYKYGEVTVFYNNSDLITDLLNWFNGNNEIDNDKKFIFIFSGVNGGSGGSGVSREEELIEGLNSFEIHTTTKNLKYKFKRDYLNDIMWFEKFSHTYFKNRKFINFNTMFSNYLKFNSCVIEESKHNNIYHRNEYLSNKDKFAIIRIKSSKNTERYYFSYDSNDFTKEEIVCLIQNLIS